MASGDILDTRKAGAWSSGPRAGMPSVLVYAPGGGFATYVATPDAFLGLTAAGLFGT